MFACMAMCADTLFFRVCDFWGMFFHIFRGYNVAAVFIASCVSSPSINNCPGLIYGLSYDKSFISLLTTIFAGNNTVVDIM